MPDAFHRWTPISLNPRLAPAGAFALVVATLNVRNTADRWRARAPLLVEQLVELDPDLISVQEVRRIPGQARGIAREADRRREEGLGPGSDERPWEVHTAYKSGVKRLWEGMAVLSRLPVTDRARLRLGGQARVALRVTVTVPDGRTLDVYTTHLADGDKKLRCSQARRLLAWMDERPGVAQVLMGDFNSAPGTAPYRVLTGRLRSAYAVVHRAEPERTQPTGGTLDYIFVNDLVTVLDAWVAFDRPSPDDPGLFPSDHFGVAASLSLRPPPPPPG